MKKKQIIICIAFIAVCFLLIYSCKKDLKEINTVNKNTHSTARLFDEETDEEIVELIQGFINGLDDPENAEDLILEEIEWFIEASLNFQYALTDSLWDTIICDTFNYNIAHTDGISEFTNIADFYTEAFENLDGFYDNISLGGKHLVLVSVYMYEEGEEDSDFAVVSKVGCGTNSASSSDFTSSDYWLHDAGRGKCGGYSGGIGDDAATKITAKVNFDLAVTAPSNTYYTYTNIDAVWLEPGNYNTWIPNPNDQTSGDNYYDFLLFFSLSSNSNHHDCLEPTEMNFYTNSSKDLIDDKNTSSAQITKVKCYFNLTGLTFGLNPQVYEHYADISYGRRVPHTNPPISL